SGSSATCVAIRRLPASLLPYTTLFRSNFSIWSTSDLLTDKVTEHWTGAAHGLTGYLEVDGTLYRFMGKEKLRYTSIIAEDEKAAIRYVEQSQNEAWQLPDFEDSDWKDGVLPVSDDKSVAGTF